MKQEDLRAARLIEAKRRWIEDETPRREVEHLADLYETCWTHPEPVSDDVLAMREWLKSDGFYGETNIDAGACDDTTDARAYLAGCTAARRPDGWVMVPREPTEAMIKAAWADLGDTYQRSTRNLADAYRAMLSAAPKEPDHG